MGLFRLILAAMIAAQAAPAKPLVTSSEDTLARICLQADHTPARIVAACDAALSQAGLTASQRVEMTIARADGFYWQNNYQAAVDGYRSAIKADPNASEAWNGLGWALRETEDDHAAYDAFDTSLSIEVTVQGLSGKAATGRETGALTGEVAREMLRASLAIDPDYVWAHREIGWSLIDDGMPRDAVAAFRDALGLDEFDSNARYGLGRALLATGADEDALTVFNDLLADAPDYVAARVYRIIALRDLDRNAQALRESDRLITDHPTLSSGYIERALSLKALERRSDAFETFIEAEEEIGPNNALLYWHAETLAHDGQFDAAMEVIDRALALDGSDHSDHLLKSYIALELKDYAMSRAAAEASLAVGVDDPWAHYYIAVSMVHAGEVTEGIGRFDAAMAAGLPEHRIGAFAKELVGAGKYVEAVQLRLKY